MHFIGDVHGKFNEYYTLIKSLNGDSIQLGDFGIGFSRRNQDLIVSLMKQFPKKLSQFKHRFLRGNHDNPAVCRKMPSYLGDYGYLKEEGIFFVSGAWSIDRAFRTVDVDWWKDEELNCKAMGEAVKQYQEAKPLIMATHDCPLDAYPFVTGKQYNERNSTSVAFNHMFALHQPKYWIFGHHHQTFDFKIEGTTFIVLNELDHTEIVG